MGLMMRDDPGICGNCKKAIKIIQVSYSMAWVRCAFGIVLVPPSQVVNRHSSSLAALSKTIKISLTANVLAAFFATG